MGLDWQPSEGDEEVPAASSECLLLAARWLESYAAGGTAPEPPLDETLGSPFQRAVWAETRQIPRGRVTTYGALAKRVAARLGNRPCAQAVGQALHANPWMILVPCHRVVQACGRLGGYAGGTSLKAELLLHEGVESVGSNESFI